MRVMIFMMIFSFCAIANTRVEISVKGMVCSFCAHGIEAKFKKIDQVSGIDVDLDKGKVFLDLKEKLDESLIRKIITEAGYSVEEIK